MLNLKDNLIFIFNLRRQLTLGKFDLLALALTPKGKPSGLKNHNNLNKVDTDNTLSFINYTTTDKQAEELLPIKIKIRDAETFIKIIAREPNKYYRLL